MGWFIQQKRKRVWALLYVRNFESFFPFSGSFFLFGRMGIIILLKYLEE